MRWQCMLRAVISKCSSQYRDKGILECDLDAHHRLFMTRDGEHITILKLHAALH